MGDVIDLKQRLKTAEQARFVGGTMTSEVVSIVEKRAEKIQEDRRAVKRTILTEFVSVHAIIPNYGLMRVSLYDINDKGLAFDIDERRGQYNIGESIELRVYLNHQTYFKIDVKIAHVTHLTEEGLVRHGCIFSADALNSEALGHFIKFLETVTASLRRDGGDVLVSNINS